MPPLMLFNLIDAIFCCCCVIPLNPVPDGQAKDSNQAMHHHPLPD